MSSNEEEITVKAPSKSVLSPEKTAEKKTEKAIEEERFGVLNISYKLGRYLGFTIIGVGFLLFALISYIILTGQITTLIISAELASPIWAFWIFLGLINIIIGFLLISGE